MRLASFLAPALRWGFAALLVTALSVSAQAQQIQAQTGHENEILTPDTHIITPTGVLQDAVRCATPSLSEAQYRANDADVAAFLAQHGGSYRAGGTVTIPIAFHVVNQGAGSGNGDVPQAWIDAQIDVLNAAFEGKVGGAYNTNFRFELDFVDRTTNATWYTGCYGSQENPMKQALNFSPATHLNIYSCRPSSGILGYSYLPSTFPESDYRHGVVMLDQSMPGGNAFPYNLGDTATHEIGHYLGLDHTFAGACAGGDTPPGCQTSGDRVCDTAAESSPAFGCPAGRNTCGTGGPDPIDNFMDYTDDSCMNKFTQGQSERMDVQVATYKPTLLLGGSCQQSIAATVNDNTPAPGQTITFTVTVANNAASSATIDLWFEAFRNGNQVQRGRIASGTLPAGASTTRSIPFRVPPSAPAGVYDFNMIIGDYNADDECDTAPFVLTVSAPLTGDVAADASAQFEADGTGFFDAAAATPVTASVAPNPFSGQTQIRYAVQEATDVRLAVYDVLGREVAVLVDRRVEAGAHSATFEARDLAAGTYIYRLTAGDEVQTGRMTIAR